MAEVIKTCKNFLQRETVLCAAAVLALVSACIVPPDPGYASYVDWDTLALLFSLMAVMKGFQKVGLFTFLGSKLLQKTKTTRAMLFVLVFLPFFFSMLITNDVALITFVPFALIVLPMAGQQRLLVPLVVMQTVAANLGSMLTPMGNPQNLYLYAKFGLGFWEFFRLMAPYAAIAALLLAVMVFCQGSAPIPPVSVEAPLGDTKWLLRCAVGFGLCLLCIFKQLMPLAVALMIGVFLLFGDKKLLASVDYSLLGTFIAFFIFIGNVGRIDFFQSFLSSALTGHVELVAVLASQVISNVPAALLLSGFTNQWQALAIGCNLGVLGTLIASMASLISYKVIVGEHPHLRQKYFFQFTLWNLCFLGLLLLAHFLLLK